LESIERIGEEGEVKRSSLGDQKGIRISIFTFKLEAADFLLLERSS
jgi:hypothetical protein